MGKEILEQRKRRRIERTGGVIESIAYAGEKEKASRGRVDYYAKINADRKLRKEAAERLAEMGYGPGSLINVTDESGKKVIKGTLGEYNPQLGQFSIKGTGKRTAISVLRLFHLLVR